MSQKTSHTAPSALARPAAFGDEPFADALARAAAERRWLVVAVADAGSPASWAAGYTTWRDPDLVAWLEANAVAIQADVRAEPETAFILGVDAASAPAVLVFRDGRERLRIRGRQPAAELLSQLTRIDTAEEKLAWTRRVFPDPERNVESRDQLAEALLDAGVLDEALVHYDWLWQHMAEVDPEKAGVRVSFMARKLGELCDRLPAARARFAAHRDAAAARASLDDRAGRSACEDMIALNDVIGDDDHSLAWLDRLDIGQRRLLRGGFISLHLIPLLYERERWADAGELIENPLEDLEGITDRATRFQSTKRVTDASSLLLIEEGRLREARSMQRRFGHGLHRDVEMLHRSLRAAGRTEEAAAVQEAALRFEDSPAMRAALKWSAC